MKRRLPTWALLAVALLGAAPPAFGYCRARTCNPDDPKQTCELDAEGCVLTGLPLSWSSSCVSFDVQAEGSPKSGIDADETTRVAKRAFAAWVKADCDGDPPSISVGTFGPVACDESRYNEHGRNANIVMFHDESWPYYGGVDTFAQTLVRFSTVTGEIYDADIEINSAQFDVTTDESDDGADLESILTHEFGHFLGLAHTGSEQPDATMRAGWNGLGLDLRTLTADDAAGICEAYPPGRSAGSSCEPRHGFSGECFVPLPAQEQPSCSSAAPAGSHDTGSASLAACFAFTLWRRRAMKNNLRPLRART